MTLAAAGTSWAMRVRVAYRTARDGRCHPMIETKLADIRRRLVRGLGEERADALLRETLAGLNIERLKTADDLLRLGVALGRHDGLVSAVGAATRVQAMLRGAAPAGADQTHDQTHDQEPCHPFHVDETRWPVVVVVVPARLDDDALVAVLDRLQRAYARGDKIALVYDARVLALPTAQQRRFIGESIHATEQQHPGQLVAVAFATRNDRLMAGLLTALGWVMPPQPQPARIFPSVDEGVAWASSMLGVPPQPGANVIA